MATAESAHELRIVVFGKSEDKKKALCKSIVGIKQTAKQQFFKINPTKQCEAASGDWGGNPLNVVKTPDLFSLSVETFREEMRSCATLCSPVPNVLLLLVKPSEFTEEDRKTLKFILSLFGPDAFKHSMVIVAHEWNKSNTVSQLLQDCGGRCYSMVENNRMILMQKIENIVHGNKGTFVTFSEEIKPVLNLVLCGRRGAVKTSAAKVILGQTEVHSECVKHQGEVCGRWVSLVELPALYGKPQEEVMEESFRCVSLCDPEGVHAFILVLPVAPLTDEDKGEIRKIQNTFSSRVNDFTMILFTVESDPTAPAVVNFVNQDKDIQELCQSFGGRSVVLSTKDQEQIQELLEAVEKMRFEGSRCFTKDMFTMAQMEKVVEQQNTNARLKGELFDSTEKSTQIQVERILKEKEEEMARKEEDLRRKHEEDLEALKKKFKEQSVEIVQERAKQLKDKDEVLNKEREERKKEQEEEVRRRKKQEETQRQKLKRNLEASEKIIQLEREQKENAEKKLELFRKEMKRDREAWDKERKDIWEQRHQEDKQNLEEEKSSLRKLQDEYYRRKMKWTYSLFVLLLFLLFLVYYLFPSYVYTHTTESAKTKEHT